MIAGMRASARQHRRSGHAVRGRHAHTSANGRCQQLWQQDQPPATRTSDLLVPEMVLTAVDLLHRSPSQPDMIRR